MISFWVIKEIGIIFYRTCALSFFHTYIHTHFSWKTDTTTTFMIQIQMHTTASNSRTRGRQDRHTTYLLKLGFWNLHGEILLHVRACTAVFPHDIWKRNLPHANTFMKISRLFQLIVTPASYAWGTQIPDQPLKCSFLVPINNTTTRCVPIK